MEKWIRDLNNLVNRKKVSISYYNSDRYNHRIEDSMGDEDEYEGFSSVIFYFQLSNNIDTNKVKEAIRSIVRNANSYTSSKTKLCTLFLNDENYKLIYPKEAVYNYPQVSKLIDEYYTKYSIEKEPYSNNLCQLFPTIDIYSRRRYPSSEDLCVVFHDDNGISIDDNIIHRVFSLRKRFIFVNTTINKDVSVIDGGKIISKDGINVSSIDKSNQLELLSDYNLKFSKEEYSSWKIYDSIPSEIELQYRVRDNKEYIYYGIDESDMFEFRKKIVWHRVPEELYKEAMRILELVCKSGLENFLIDKDKELSNNCSTASTSYGLELNKIKNELVEIRIINWKSNSDWYAQSHPVFDEIIDFIKKIHS